MSSSRSKKKLEPVRRNMLHRHPLTLWIVRERNIFWGFAVGFLVGAGVSAIALPSLLMPVIMGATSFFLMATYLMAAKLAVLNAELDRREARKDGGA